MYVWRFQQFKTWSGRAVIADWRNSLLPARKAVFDLFLNRIAKMESWPNGICDPIKKHSRCWELRWTSERVEHRIFGFYGAAKQFNMMVGCTHKGNVYDPPGAFDTLDRRKADVENGKGVLDEYREHEK